MNQTEKKLKIMFVCRHFDGVAGGVERMAIALMNAMVMRGHTVHLITWDPPQARAFYPMDERIIWHRIPGGDPNIRATWRDRWSRARQVRNILRAVRPNVAIGFQFGSFLVAWLYGLGLRIPVIAAERNSPSRYQFLKEKNHRHWHYLLMSGAKFVTIQFASYRKYYPFYLQSKIRSIHNPVPLPVGNDSPSLEERENIILAVGRLSYQKNYPCLLYAFSEVLKYDPNWVLMIAGDGEDKGNLYDLATTLKINEHIIWLGAVRGGMPELYQKAKFFIMPSRWEGFPNALAEAMGHGLPAIGFKGCDGVADLILPGQTGILVSGNDDWQSLAQAIKEMIQRKEDWTKMSLASKDRIKSYEPEDIFNQWEKIFFESCV